MSRFPQRFGIACCAFLILTAACGPRDENGEPEPEPAPVGLDARPANATCLAPDRPPSGAAVELVDAFPNLGPTFSLPLDMHQAPGDPDRFFVVEKSGRVRVLTLADEEFSTWIDLTARVNSNANEGGLLGMAFHPRYAENGEVYLSFTAGPNADLRSVVSRFRTTNGGALLDPDSEEVLLEVSQPANNHNGGGLAFGPDGYLYLGLGDGGGSGDPFENGQDPHTLLGAMVRIDVDQDDPVRGTAYAIPPDNPFADGEAGAPEVYAYGLRNPWRFSFDFETGDLWAADVGQDRVEEVNVIRRGGNYGWPIKEGTECYLADTCDETGLIDPIVEYLHPEGAGRRSVTGGYVYRGSRIAALQGVYVYGDFLSGQVWGLFFDASGDPDPQELIATGRNISSFGQSLDGELFLLDFVGGRIFRFEPNDAEQVEDTFPRTLSETGCVDPADPTRMAPGVIPFDVNVALWSDGTEKERFLAVPDDATITVEADGNWVLPVGTVLIKNFFHQGVRIETRLLVRHDDGEWAGYSYAWNASETEADLLPGARVVELPGLTWTFPSRSDCMACHTAVMGRSLGLETAQLNGLMHYEETGRLSNQVATLAHIGLLEGLPSAEPAALAAYPGPDADAPIADRARAYLHANCAMCHQPGGPGRGELDLRAATPLAEASLCDEQPQGSDLGVAGARLVVPGEPSRSLVSLRIHDLGLDRMPPLGSQVVDPEGTELVDGWIAGMSSCP
jgi:uncharacterized repeat protein (TIGR03806 family)